LSLRMRAFEAGASYTVLLDEVRCELAQHYMAS
jgi:hypothetical protein